MDDEKNDLNEGAVWLDRTDRDVTVRITAVIKYTDDVHEAPHEPLRLVRYVDVSDKNTEHTTTEWHFLRVFAPTESDALPPAAFADAMTVAFTGDDTESNHCDGDALMCDVLRALGYGEGVDVFENAHKRYA